MMRVGHYIGRIELEINKRVGASPMGWESQLREGSMKNLQLRQNYLAVLFAFLSIAFAAPYAGDAAVVNLLNDIAPEQWFHPLYLGYSVSWGLVAGVAFLNIIVTIIWLRMYRTVRTNGRRIVYTYAEAVSQT